ncbi:MAG: 4Fe-4S dicluster domain-containing protein [Nitrospirae bacterium]|nr:4Fe-4S dicluster domain-containing protein [Nitrospirota bacterium]
MSIAEKAADNILNSHQLTIENRLCCRFRTPKSDCRACVDLCPMDAIELSDKGAEIAGGCNNCGVCISVCPNSVFSFKERDDKNILRELEAKINSQKLKILRISCERGDSSADLIVPCLGRLTENLLLEPVRLGVEKIEILQPPSKKCPNNKVLPHINRIIERTIHLYSMLGLKIKGIFIYRFDAYMEGDIEQQHKAEDSRHLSRRGFLGIIKQKTLNAAAASIPDAKDKKEEIFRDIIQSRPENYKRMLLLKAVRDIGSNAESREAEVSSKDAMLAELEINNKCTGCGVCATLCPTGAITQKSTENRFYLYFTPALCTNCDVCVKTCMPQAISIKDKVSLNMLSEQRETSIFEAGKKTCIVCRLDFIGSNEGVCPLCMERHQKQMSAMANLLSSKKEIET